MGERDTEQDTTPDGDNGSRTTSCTARMIEKRRLCLSLTPVILTFANHSAGGTLIPARGRQGARCRPSHPAR
jgi:hypothetical protein